MLEQSLLVVGCGQAASLAFLFYDICLTFDDEVNKIWTKPNYCWIKWQFLFIRYFALSAQILNRAIESVVKYNKPMAKDSFKLWYICQVILGCISMTAMEIVLMTRVYALYNKKIWVGMVFVGLVISEVIVVIVGVVVNMPSDNLDTSSILLSTPHSYTYFGISAIVCQITILAFTLVKYKVAVRGGWDEAPVMMLMVRDGTAAFVVLSVIVTLTVITTSNQTLYAPIGNSWLLSIVACSGCRLIINMLNLPVRPEIATNCSMTTVQLTSLCNDFDMDIPLEEDSRSIQRIERTGFATQFL